MVDERKIRLYVVPEPTLSNLDQVCQHHHQFNVNFILLSNVRGFKKKVKPHDLYILFLKLIYIVQGTKEHNSNYFYHPISERVCYFLRTFLYNFTLPLLTLTLIWKIKNMIFAEIVVHNNNVSNLFKKITWWSILDVK